ncbi:KLC1, partial [Symbiodinium necroappetens]
YVAPDGPVQLWHHAFNLQDLHAASVNSFVLLCGVRGDWRSGCRAKLGDDRPQRLSFINNLAGLLEARGQLQEAEPLYSEALCGCRAKLGDDHPNTLSNINNLAGLLGARGLLEEAAPLYREALQGTLMLLMRDPGPGVEPLMLMTCGLLEARGLLEEAEPLYRE